MLVDALLQLHHDELYSSLLTSVATRKAHALYSVLLVLRWSLPKPHFRGKMRDTNLTHLFAMMYAQKKMSVSHNRLCNLSESPIPYLCAVFLFVFSDYKTI